MFGREETNSSSGAVLLVLTWFSANVGFELTPNSKLWYFWVIYSNLGLLTDAILKMCRVEDKAWILWWIKKGACKHKCRLLSCCEFDSRVHSNSSMLCPSRRGTVNGSTAANFPFTLSFYSVKCDLERGTLVSELLVNVKLLHSIWMDVELSG